jgi:ElaA protein
VIFNREMILLYIPSDKELMNKNNQWQVKHFNDLTNDELYDALKLRVDVFVVEQTCYYPDLDDKDRHPETLHLFSYSSSNRDENNNDSEMSSYLRILAKGQSYDNYVSIGRVVIAPKARGTGLGHELMSEALSVCQSYFPDHKIKISAQEHLEKYYNKHGFVRVSAMYLEDDIPHIAMIKDVK